MAKLERAIVGRGEWHFTQQYGDSVIAESAWFSQMSDAAKKAHVKSVQFETI